MKQIHTRQFPYPVLLALVFLVSLTATAYIAYYVYHHMPHVEDEVSQCFQAKIFASGQLWAPEPEHPEFFKKINSTVFYQGRVFSQYPYGHSLMLSLGYLLGVPWLIAPVVSSLSLIVIMLIYRELYGADSPSLIPILCISSPYFLFLAGSYMNHTTCLLFISVFLLFFFKALRMARTCHFAFSALFLGFAFCTRPLTAIFIALPFIVYLAICSRHGVKVRAAHVIVFLVVLICICATLLIYNYLIIGSFTPMISTISERELSLEKFGHDRFRAIGFGKNVGSFGGHTPQRALYNTNVNLGNLMVQLYGWPVFFTLSFILIPFLTVRWKRWDWLLLIGILALPIGYFFYFHYGHSFGPRYWFEALPLILILTARGIQKLAYIIEVRQISPSYCRACAYALVGFLVFINLASWVPSLPDKQPYPYFYFSFRPAIRDTIQKTGIRNALIFIRQRDPDNYDFITAFELNSANFGGDIVIARDLGPKKNRILMKAYPGRAYFIGDWTQKRLIPLKP